MTPPYDGVYFNSLNNNLSNEALVQYAMELIEKYDLIKGS